MDSGIGDLGAIWNFPIEKTTFCCGSPHTLENKLQILRQQREMFDKAIKRTEEMIAEREAAKKVAKNPGLYT